MQRVLFVVCCFFALGSAFRNETESLRCGPNEISACVQECPPERTCRNRGIAFRCKYVPDSCKEKCICASGYYRNSIGECITEAQCDKCSAPNEFYSCNSACDNACENIHLQNRTHCPIKNIVCNKWCYCDDGYARDATGKCIPVNQCDVKCGPNEYFTCRLPCPPETCFSLTARFYCPNQKCEPQCACKPGFLRLRQGSPCIPMCKCPQVANTPECRKFYRPSF